MDLNTVITDVMSLLEHQFGISSIKIRRELWAAPVPVSGIEHQLQQVFLNLFLNARDAMPSGGWLTASTRIEDGQVVAEVADTGSGIPPEHLARIYDPFFTTKAIGRGTGLGLSITYGIVHEHDGLDSLRQRGWPGYAVHAHPAAEREPGCAARRAVRGYGSGSRRTDRIWLEHVRARSSSSTTRRSCATFSRRCWCARATT